MSVINKMLSEMDKRENKTYDKYVPPVKSHRLNFILLGIVLVILLIFAVFFGYKYYSLKSQNSVSYPENKLSQTVIADKKVISDQLMVDSQAEDLKQTSRVIQDVENSAEQAISLDNQQITKDSTEKDSLLEESNQNIKNLDTVSNINEEKPIEQLSKQEVLNKETNNEELVEFDTSDNIEFIPQEEEKTKQNSTKVKSLKITSSKLSIQEEVELLRKKANNSFVQGKKKDAIGIYKTILNKKPSDIKAREHLAAIYFGEKNVIEAAKVLNKGIELTPQHYDYRLFLARVYASNRRLPLAIKVLRQASPPIQGNGDYYATLAQISLNAKDYESAEYAYRKLCTSKTTDGKWFMGLGIVLEHQNKKVEALNSYKKASKLYLSSSSAKFVQKRIDILGAENE
jgi:tetratricopeptide (TPR) repeat protein